MRPNRYVWGLFFLALSLFVAALFTSGIEWARAAYILVEQQDVSSYRPATSYTVPPYSFNGYVLPGGIAGVLNEVDLVAAATTTGRSINAQILCFTDFALTSPCDSSWGSGSGNLFSDGGNQSIPNDPTPHRYDFTYTGYDAPHRTMLADHFYVLEFQGTITNVQISGDAAGNPAYVFYGLTTDTTTRIVQINSPTNGAVLAVPTVAFSFDYYIGTSTYTTAGITLTDNSIGQSMIGPATSTISASGESTYTGSIQLTVGHSYSWSPELSGGADPALFGSTYTFSISNGTTGTTTVPDFFQGLWNGIQNNPPFGFIFQIRTQLLALNASSTPAIELNLAAFELDNIFHPIDLGLASVMYLVFGVWLLKRASHLEL